MFYIPKNHSNQMSGLVHELFSFLRELLSFTLIVIFIILILGSVFAYLTKPTDESFRKFLTIELNKKTQSRVITYLAKKTLDKEIQDYVFWKLARVRCVYDDRQEDVWFLGLFSTWGRMPNN